MGKLLKYLLTLVFVVSAGLAWSQPQMVAFYNVENLMDTRNDPATQDDDMLPNAEKEWNEERYQAKLSAVAGVVADMSNEYGYPSLLGLAEVENKAVLSDLVKQQAISGANYRFVHYDSHDERGIDVALLYCPDRFHLERSCSVRADVELPTRDILMVWGELSGEDVLVVVVHFPSRIGGEEFTSAFRESCARQLCELVESARSVEPHRKVIIMGDMNDTPRDSSIKRVLGAKSNARHLQADDIFNPFTYCRKGSMVYQYRWYLYDQILLSSDFVPHSGCSAARGYVYRQKSLLDKNRAPKPTYRGAEYMGGVSDHLPVYVLLQLN